MKRITWLVTSLFAPFSATALFAMAVGAIAGGAQAASEAKGAPAIAELPLLGPDYPRAFFFRSSEAMAAKKENTYEQWDKTFNQLMGIIGKALDEEVPGRAARNPEFFTRLKQAHPQEAVLLHFNGNARDPRFEAQDFFAGHWVYFNGAKIAAAIPAVEGETDIPVSNPNLFQTNIGRYKRDKDDIGLCLLDAQGRPDWSQSEQVQLVSIDAKKGIIRVKRGCYGTKPRAFPARGAYAAAHATEGPWGPASHCLWFYNYSTLCPRDAQGRQCADVLSDDLAKRFALGGQLAAFDGLEFDVLSNRRGPASGLRGTDCDADGKADGGIAPDGTNAYGAGVIEFCRKLRGKMGEGKFIMADGHSPNAQRAFGILNGIESEGWPNLSDAQIADWSGGINRHFYWDQNGRRPVFNYFNHKFIERGGDLPAEVKKTSVPFSTHRLVLAAAQFTNAAVCYSNVPPKEDDDLIGIWDELRMGKAHRLSWLGKPLGPAIRLATRQPDLLAGQGAPISADLMKRFSGAGAKLTLEAGSLRAEGAAPQDEELAFRLKDVPCNGPDLFVTVTARAETLRGYPAEAPRLMWVGVAGGGEALDLVRSEMPKTGMRVRGKEEGPLTPESNGNVHYEPKVTHGGTALKAYAVHPPYGPGGTGYTFWEREVAAPANARLVFYTGMSEKAPSKSDGVVFIVMAAEVKDGKTGEYVELFREGQVASEWRSHTISLDRWSGKTVSLKFISDCGPKDNATTDQSSWGDVRVVSAGKESAPVTKAVRHMTWAGAKDFTSGFYFSAIASPKVDLEFAVEGGEPIWISEIKAYAHPDATARNFENGAVVANPSPREYTFDLDELFPGAMLRRFEGSSKQDPKTNNGQPVAGKLTLAPKDALFLVKTSGAAK